ncbi:MAG: hypothetical protein Q8N63_02760 [Nanoarchaeota archaeon]|nr:hypothetical protein [Nanoarchaeota archaeon]
MVKIIGERIELPGKVIVERPDRPYAFPRQISPLITKTHIKPEDYALIQEGDEANSAISMIQRNFGERGKNHLDTNVEVLSSGLIVPRTSKFITQLINVNRALGGKGVLYDASGNLIESQRLRDYAHTLNHKCWARLNGSFEKGEGFLDLNVVYITGLENGNPVFQKEPLQTCLEQDCYADFESVNNQGFPTQKSPIQKYEPGKSIRFCYPRQNMAVGFGAYSDGADLSCSRNPQYTVAWLGVFDCAEDASAEKLGDTK